MKTVQKVSKDAVQLADNPSVTEGTHLCLDCRKMLKNPQSLFHAGTAETTEEQINLQSVNSPELTSNQTSHNTSTEEIVLAAEATETVGEVLAALGHSPMRLSKSAK